MLRGYLIVRLTLHRSWYERIGGCCVLVCKTLSKEVSVVVAASCTFAGGLGRSAGHTVAALV